MSGWENTPPEARQCHVCGRRITLKDPASLVNSQPLFGLCWEHIREYGRVWRECASRS